MSEFLMKTHPEGRQYVDRLLNEYKEGKGFRYFTSGWLKEVCVNEISPSSKYCFLKAVCTPSQRINDPGHDVWVCARKASETARQIWSAYCSCVNGLTGTCNHVAALLFRVEAAVRKGLVNPACTSLPCSWDIPNSKTSVKPSEGADINFKLEKYCKEGSRPMVSGTKRLYSAVKPQYAVSSEERRNRFKRRLQDVIPDACIFPPKSKDLPLDEDLSVLIMSDIARDNKGEPSDFVSTLPTLTTETIQCVSKHTVQQSQTAIWQKLRSGRITASNFYAVLTKWNSIKENSSSDPTQLCNLILGKEKHPDLPQFKYGRSMEKVAATKYDDHLVGLGHTGVKVEQSGMFLSGTKPFLAASPDFLVKCFYGDGLMECKALYSVRDQNLSDNLPNSLISKNGQLALKPNHMHYGQVQGQMALTNRSWCDLFVCTDNSELVIRVKFDEPFWDKFVSSLAAFYESIVVPRLLNVAAVGIDAKRPVLNLAAAGTEDPKTPPAASPQLNDPILCPVCTSLCKEEKKLFKDASIGCDKCNKWFHCKCVGIKSRKSLKQIEKLDWFCSDC